MHNELRNRVWEANMELFQQGLVVYTWGNVSEIDREKDAVAIKPSGVPYESLRPEDIVVLRLSTGERIEGALRPSSDAPTHLALYRAFPDIGGVTHTHSPCATAFAQAGRSIPCLGTTHADYFAGEIPCTRFLSEREVESDYEAETGLVIAETFGERVPLHTPAVLVRGHGPFAFGKDAAESVYHARVLEEVAKMALSTFAISPETQPIPMYILHKHFERKHGPNAYYGQK